MEDKFDEKIIRMLNEDIYIPQKTTNRIKTSLKEEKKGVWLRMKFKKIVAITLGILIIGTGAVFATKAFIESRNSVEIANENGYFETVDTPYITNAGLSIKLVNYFIDNGRIGITMDVKSEEGVGWLELYNTPITRNNDYYETADKELSQNDCKIAYSRRFDIIKFIDENGNEIYFNDNGIGGRGPESTYKDLGNNVVRVSYTAPLYEDVTTNKMKIIIKRVINHREGKEKEYIGDWEFEIDIADKYLDKSKSIEYTGTTNFKDLVVEKAELGATKLIVTVKADNLKKLLYGSEEEYGKVELFGRVKLFGQEGEYDAGNVSTEQSNYYEENKITFRFDISKFSSENSYSIVMPAVHEDDSDIVITLNK